MCKLHFYDRIIFTFVPFELVSSCFVYSFFLSRKLFALVRCRLSYCFFLYNNTLVTTYSILQSIVIEIMLPLRFSFFFFHIFVSSFFICSVRFLSSANMTRHSPIVSVCTFFISFSAHMKSIAVQRDDYANHHLLLRLVIYITQYQLRQIRCRALIKSDEKVL